jgi:hypothetical protein
VVEKNIYSAVLLDSVEVVFKTEMPAGKSTNTFPRSSEARKKTL